MLSRNALSLHQPTCCHILIMKMPSCSSTIVMLGWSLVGLRSRLPYVFHCAYGISNCQYLAKSCAGAAPIRPWPQGCIFDWHLICEDDKDKVKRNRPKELSAPEVTSIARALIDEDHIIWNCQTIDKLSECVQELCSDCSEMCMITFQKSCVGNESCFLFIFLLFIVI